MLFQGCGVTCIFLLSTFDSVYKVKTLAAEDSLIPLFA